MMHSKGQANPNLDVSLDFIHPVGVFGWVLARRARVAGPVVDGRTCRT